MTMMMAWLCFRSFAFHAFSVFDVWNIIGGLGKQLSRTEVPNLSEIAKAVQHPSYSPNVEVKYCTSVCFQCKIKELVQALSHP